ncbi:MAG: hypothetical protein U9O97_00040 [Elusimicrobiota bacterium]|nr:hypothetical protein [Elusimicrobiota bacterium]
MNEEEKPRRIRPKYRLQKQLPGGTVAQWNAETGKTVHRKWKPYRPAIMGEEKIRFSGNIRSFEYMEFITSPSFRGPWRIGFYKRGGKYFAAHEDFKRKGYVYDELDTGSPLEKCEPAISEEKAMEALGILKELVKSRKGITRSADDMPAMGCDGTILEFKFKSGSSTVFFQWWMALPKGYDLLDDLHSFIDDCIPI